VWVSFIGKKSVVEKRIFLRFFAQWGLSSQRKFRGNLHRTKLLTGREETLAEKFQNDHLEVAAKRQSAQEFKSILLDQGKKRKRNW